MFVLLVSLFLFVGDNMRNNKLILFDWGGIVESHKTGYNCYSAWTDLLTMFGSIKDSSVLMKYELSALSTIEELEKAYDLIKEECKLTANFNEFVEKYYEVFDKVEYYKDVRDYEHSLKDKCYIGVLSNLLIIDKDRINKQLGLSNYDYVFLSFELGCRKPDIKIFEKVQNKLPFDKNDILFIDDKTMNIESAKKFGWNTLQATGLELDKIKEEVERFLNK